MQDLNIALLQTKLIWENPSANHEMLEGKISVLGDDIDLLILPEMFNTGFTVNPESFYELQGGTTFRWMQDIAEKKQFALMGSIIVKENDTYYNRLYVVSPDRGFSYYDKRHLFRMGKEHLRFSPGKGKSVVSLNAWNIMPMVCYDLRFPVWSKNRMIEGRHEYDLMVYVANWPAARSHAWKSLLLGRAIENQSFVIGVNRVGADGQGIDYSGDSMAVDPLGNILAQGSPDKEELIRVRLSSADLESTRKEFQVGLDWDQFSIENE